MLAIGITVAILVIMDITNAAGANQTKALILSLASVLACGAVVAILYTFVR